VHLQFLCASDFFLFARKEYSSIAKREKSTINDELCIDNFVVA